jgi:hypothetical protein
MKPTETWLCYLALFSFLVSTTSCNKSELEFDNLQTSNLEAQWGIPLVNSKLTLEDFLTDSIGSIQVDHDSAITIVYESRELVSKDAEERTKIKDQVKILNQTFEIPDSIPPGITGEVPLTFFFTIDLTEPGQRIDSMILKSGSYHLILRTNLNISNAQIHLDIPNFVEGSTGELLNCDFDVSNAGGGEIMREITFDLSNYYLNIPQSNNGNDSVNTIFIYAQVHFVTGNNQNLSPYHITLENHLTDLSYSLFTGYIGYWEESYTDTIDLGIYNAADFGAILFGPESVRMKIQIENQLGLPIIINAEQLTAIHTQDDSNESVEIRLFGPGQPNSFPINSPSFDQVGETMVTNILSENSNIVEALNIAPNKILLKLVGYLNPNANNEVKNFFFSNSQLKIGVTLEMDLYGRIDEFRIADTLDFSISNDEHFNGLEFNSVITNSFPIDGKAQVLFTDDDYNVLYSLFPEDESIIISGVTGPPPASKVISPSKKVTSITLGSEEIEKILEATQLIFRTTLGTEPDKMVRIYSDYNVELNLSAKFHVNY